MTEVFCFRVYRGGGVRDDIRGARSGGEIHVQPIENNGRRSRRRRCRVGSSRPRPTDAIGRLPVQGRQRPEQLSEPERRWTAQDEQEPVGAQPGGGGGGRVEPRIGGRRTVGRRQAAPAAQARCARAVVDRRPGAAQSAHAAPTGHVNGHARLQPAVLATPIPSQQFWPVDVQQQQLQQHLWQFQLQQRQQARQWRRYRRWEQRVDQRPDEDVVQRISRIDGAGPARAQRVSCDDAGAGQESPVGHGQAARAAQANARRAGRHDNSVRYLGHGGGPSPTAGQAVHHSAVRDL